MRGGGGVPIRSVAGVGVLVAAVVAAATVAGLRVSGTKAFGAFGHPALDYGRPAGDGFSPLRPDLIASLFGFGVPFDGRPPPLRFVAEPRFAPDRGGVMIRDAAHDEFANATEIEQIEYTDVARTTSATRQQGEPSTCGAIGGTVWYRYSPPLDLNLQASTVGSNYGTNVAVFEGTSMSNLKPIVCKGGEGGAEADFTGRAGATYFIQVGATNVSPGGTLVFYLGQRSFTVLESVTDRGTGGNQWSADGSLSRDGRYVLMQSYATNLARGTAGEPGTCAGRPAGYPGVAGTQAFSPNCMWRMYLRDRVSGVTELVSQTSSGVAATDAHAMFSRSSAVISGAGRFVVFSSASRILDGDNVVGASQIYLRDRDRGTTTRLVPRQRRPSARKSSGNAQLTADGRYVFFDSAITDLVAGDTNEATDVFRLDRQTGRVVRVSLSAAGRQLPRGSSLQQITPDGRFALVLGESDGVTQGDDNGFPDLFVYDVELGTVDKISVATSGAQSNSSVYRSVHGPANGISDDGRFVVFMSPASTLVRNDTNDAADSFVRDRLMRTTTRITVSFTGAQSTSGDRGTQDPTPNGLGRFYMEGCSISGDGRYVMLSSEANNLVPGDDNRAHDVFIVDRVTRVARTVSRRISGLYSNGPSFGAAMSSDAETVLFMSLTADRDGADPASPGDLYIRVVPHSDRPVRYRW